MRVALRLVTIATSSLAVLAALPNVALAQHGRVSVGPLVGSAPGAEVEGGRVPTVGIVGDIGLLRAGPIGVHVGGTLEHRAGARMTGAMAGIRLPMPARGLALRVAASIGDAEVRRFSWDDQLGWRDWRGVDAGLELRFGRTTGAFMVRTGTIDRFAWLCPPNALCTEQNRPAPAPSRFTRFSLESRYALF